MEKVVLADSISAQVINFVPENPAGMQSFLRVGQSDGGCIWYTPFAAGFLILNNEDQDRLEKLFKEMK